MTIDPHVPKLIYVEWVDSMGNHDKWITEEEARDWGDEKVDMIYEIGYLIRETKDFIILAARVNPQYLNDEFHVMRVDGVQKIPKSQIRKRKEIKI